MNEDWQTKTEEGSEPLFADLPSQDKRRKLPVVAQLGVIGLLLGIAFSGSFLPSIWPASDSSDVSTLATLERDDDDLEPANHFANLSLVADSAFVWDVSKNEVLFDKNPDKQLPIASITKLMTILLAHELMLGDATVTIDVDATQQAGDSNLRPGERFSLETLSDLTLITSSNDGAYALAASTGKLLDAEEPAAAFVKAMNVRAEELGLNQTYFRNPTGLDLTEEEAGAYGSARDITFLVSYLAREYPEILEASTNEQQLIFNQVGEYHQAENTNQNVDEIPGLIGSKTGFTTLAGGNLTMVFDAGVNRPVVVTVLGSTFNGRFDDTLKLIEAARKVISNQP